MNTCSVLRGFYVLRECTAPATAQCSQCARAICAEHTAGSFELNPQVLCVECHAQTFGSGIYARRQVFYRDHPLSSPSGCSPEPYSTADIRAFDRPADIGSSLDGGAADIDSVTDQDDVELSQASFVDS